MFEYIINNNPFPSIKRINCTIGQNMKRFYFKIFKS